MARISEQRFSGICDQIVADRAVIIANNPLGSDEEILLWMLLGVLASYLSLSELETPCFSGKPNADTYRDAIRFVLNGRTDGEFDPEPYLVKMR
jgi:hypothetical protein